MQLTQNRAAICQYKIAKRQTRQNVPRTKELDCGE